MHTITLPSPEVVAAVVAALGSSGTVCSQAKDGTWLLSLPDALAAQADALAANPPPPPLDLRAYAASALAAKFAAGETFNVAASGSVALPILCDGTNDTRADLGLLALYGQDNPTGTRAWIDNDGVASVLTGAQFVTLATLAGTWVSDCYPVLATILAGIASGKVTAAAQIDAAFAAVTA